MLRFHTFKWNKHDKEYTMIILSEDDIQKETDLNGAGFEILVIPNKYKDVENKYLDFWIRITNIRNGEIIYI